MKLSRALRPFTKWFHILGQSCYPSFDASDTFPLASNVNRNVYAANLVPSIVLLVLMVSATIGLWLLILHFSSHTFLDLLVVVLCISSMVITILIAVSQSIALRPQFVQLFQQINSIEYITRTRFCIDFHAFRCYYLRQILIIFVACVLALIVGSFLLRPKSSSDITVASSVVSMRFITLITMFHLLFYVCLFRCFVRAFVRYVEIQMNASKTNVITAVNVLAIKKKGLDVRDAIIELNYFKLVHFNLWEICDSMNRVFGWTFTVVLLQLSTYSIYNVYFGFVALLVPEMEFDALRKFKLINPIDLSDN